MAVDTEGIRLLLERYGYLIVFVASMAEALPLLGFLVPGQAIIILAGAAAATGLLDIRLVILVSLPAGILGDALGYYVGRYYGRSFLERYGPRLRITSKHLERSDRLFQKYGVWALIIARFSFLTRAVGALLGGMSRMRARVFWPINIVGAVLWSVSYAMLGFFFGVSFLYLQSTVGKILAWTLVGIVGFYLFYRFLKRYAGRFTRDDFYVALMGVLSGALFGVLADRVHKLGAANRLDVWFGAFTVKLHPFSPVLRAVDLVTQFSVLAVVSLALLVVLAARRRVWEAVLVGLGVGGIVVLVEAIRAIFANMLPPGPGDAFPSAHAAVTLVFSGVLVFLAAEYARRRSLVVAASAGGAVLTLLAASSRLGQGLEFPSSVLAGLALGAAWLSAAILVVEFGLKRSPPTDADAGAPPAPPLP